MDILLNPDDMEKHLSGRDIHLIHGYQQNIADAERYQPVNKAEAEIARRRVEAAVKYLMEHGESLD